MAKPASRNDLKDYCLRALGAPVVQINVADEQIEDRLDDAIQYWNESHVDGHRTVYLKHQFTAGDISDKKIDLSGVSDEIMTIDSLMEVSGDNGSDKTLTKLWQFRASIEDMGSMSLSLSNYHIQMSYRNEMRYMLERGHAYQFSRFDNSLKIHGINWDDITTDHFVVVEATVAETAGIWNERILKRYATALIKRQWGENMKKFGGVVLLGGVEMNGQQIWDEAREEIERIEEEVDDTPIDFFIG